MPINTLRQQECNGAGYVTDMMRIIKLHDKNNIIFRLSAC